MISLTKNLISKVPGIGPKRSQLFGRLHLFTWGDLLMHLPHRYENRTLKKVSESGLGQEVCFVFEVAEKKASRFKASKGTLVWGEVDQEPFVLMFFQPARFIERVFTPGQKFWVSGKLSTFSSCRCLVHPDYELFDPQKKSLHFGRWVPVYPSTLELSQKVIRKAVSEILKQVYLEHESVSELEPLAANQGLKPFNESILRVHYPRSSLANQKEYSERIFFEKYFPFFLEVERSYRLSQKERAASLHLKGDCNARVYQNFGFYLTQAQLEAWSNIHQVLAKTSPQSLLLQGDVGCGKTLIALLACWAAAESGYQSVMMVPTTLLAEQHFLTAKKLLSGLPFEIRLVTQMTSASERSDIPPNAIVIGTHALLEDTVKLARLGLVIFDEQHRFGIDQKKAVLSKRSSKDSGQPHVISMSATPIPRTLSLFLYREHLLVTVNAKPAQQLPVSTELLRDPADRPKVYQLVRQTVARKEQVFIIYPFIDQGEGEKKSAVPMFNELKRNVFPDLSLGLLHGKLSEEEKDNVIRQFRSGEISVLIATTVVEVGIDVPNATLMIVEHPERLGLSQLHQLRGRVGRGSQKGNCILLAKTEEPRFRVLIENQDGFKIADADLENRGPGQWLGKHQSGFTEVAWTMASQDHKEMLTKIRCSVDEVLKCDLLLENDYTILSKYLRSSEETFEELIF